MTKKSGKAMRKASARINVGVVGLGFMGVTHLRAYLAMPARANCLGLRPRPAAGRRRLARGGGQRQKIGRRSSWPARQGLSKTGGSAGRLRQLTWLTSAPRRPACGTSHRRAQSRQKCSLRKTTGPHGGIGPSDFAGGGVLAGFSHARHVHALLAGLELAQANGRTRRLRKGAGRAFPPRVGKARLERARHV